MEGYIITRQVAECNPHGKAGGGSQSAHGRKRLGTACKAETSRLKSVLIESS
jgi:hypothetical protein